MTGRNHEHYPDPTATEAIKNIVKGEKRITSSYAFEVASKNAVIRYMREKYGIDLTIKELQLVWFAYAMGNMRAGLYARRLGEYYPEVSYHRDDNQLIIQLHVRVGEERINSDQFDFEAKADV